MLNGDTKAKLIEVITSAVQEMIVAVREASMARDGSSDHVPRTVMAAQRSGFKALMYIFAIGIQVAEKNTKETTGKLRPNKVYNEYIMPYRKCISLITLNNLNNRRVQKAPQHQSEVSMWQRCPQLKQTTSMKPAHKKIKQEMNLTTTPLTGPTTALD